MRHLRYFAVLAELLHFRRAAARLSIAQPSLSQQIRQLEDELGTPLFVRAGRRVTLTEAGRLFQEQAHDILARADRAALLARRAGGSEGGLLRIGIGFCMDPAPATAAIGRFRERSPSTRIEVHTIALPEQFAGLRDATLDVGFVRPPVADTALASLLVASEPIVVALPTDHPLAQHARLALPALAGEAFVLLPRDRIPVYYDIVVTACGEAGFSIRAPHEVDQLAVMLAMVAAGGVIALVPVSAQRLRSSGVVFRPLQSPGPVLQTTVAWRRHGAPPLVEAFVESVLPLQPAP